MAKKKESLNHKFEYRLKPFFQTKKQRSEWQAITEQDMERIKRMEPQRYEFREVEPLQPTKNMKVDEKEG